MMTGVPIDIEKLRLARLGKGWTYRDVQAATARLGMPVAFSNYSRYERGLTSPTAARVKVLAEALDLPIAELVLPRTAA